MGKDEKRGREVSLRDGGSGRNDDDDADNEENSFFVKRKTEEKGRERRSLGYHRL